MDDGLLICILSTDLPGPLGKIKHYWSLLEHTGRGRKLTTEDGENKEIEHIKVHFIDVAYIDYGAHYSITHSGGIYIWFAYDVLHIFSQMHRVCSCYKEKC